MCNNGWGGFPRGPTIGAWDPETLRHQVSNLGAWPHLLHWEGCTEPVLLSSAPRPPSAPWLGCWLGGGGVSGFSLSSVHWSEGVLDWPWNWPQKVPGSCHTNPRLLRKSVTCVGKCKKYGLEFESYGIWEMGLGDCSYLKCVFSKYCFKNWSVVGVAG